MMRTFLFLVAIFFLVVGSTVLADPPEAKEKAQPLSSKDLTGTWRGEKDGVKVRVTFDGVEDATWQVHPENASIGASLKRVDDKESGAVLLRLDYVETATGKEGSAVLGKIERGKAGTLNLTILPVATKITAEYKPVERIPLSEVKEKKP
jgi:hypothetical protein